MPSPTKSVFPAQSPTVLGVRGGGENEKPRVDTYDFEDEDEGMELIVENAISIISSPQHNDANDQAAAIIKSPRRQQRNNVTTPRGGGRGRGGRGRGGLAQGPERPVGKPEQQPPPSPIEPLLTSPSGGVPAWQQGIVKDDLASPESNSGDLNSSYSEAELVINLEDQGTPDDARQHGQLGSDTEDKSPMAQHSPYKQQRSSRARKPPNYKAMDQGLNINLPSPRNQRAGSSPRCPRGAQSPKNPPTPRGRGSSPKAQGGAGGGGEVSPVVKLEKLDGRNQAGNKTPQRGPRGPLGLMEDSQTSKANVYEFDASDQDQPPRPQYGLPLRRASSASTPRSKRLSESSETSSLPGKPDVTSPTTNPPSLQQPQPPPPPLSQQVAQFSHALEMSTIDMSALLRRQEDQAMENVVKVIDSVARGQDSMAHVPLAERIKHEDYLATQPHKAPRGTKTFSFSLLFV
jgi:hypothetical protein